MHYKYPVNVIVVEWIEVARNYQVAWKLGMVYQYVKCAAKVQAMGAYTAAFIEVMKKKWPALQYERIQMIGFSLGVRIAHHGECAYAPISYFAKFFANGTDGKASYMQLTLSTHKIALIHFPPGSEQIGEFWALDPAGPLFNDQSDDVDEALDILDVSDALYVEVIHTCITLLGSANKMKVHAVYYVNGGQVGSANGFLTDLLQITKIDAHSSAYSVYAVESIRNHEKFPAYPCSTHAEAKENKNSCSREMEGFMNGKSPGAGSKSVMPKMTSYFCLFRGRMDSDQEE